MSLSLLPNSLYRQTTDCTEGGGLTREHCNVLLNYASKLLSYFIENFNMTMFFFFNKYCVHVLLFIYAYSYVGFKSSLELVVVMFDVF